MIFLTPLLFHSQKNVGLSQFILQERKYTEDQCDCITVVPNITFLQLFLNSTSKKCNSQGRDRENMKRTDLVFSLLGPTKLMLIFLHVLGSLAKHKE